MKQTVQLFAKASELAGTPLLTLELTAGSRVADLRAELSKCCPALASLAAPLLIAVNEAYAEDGMVIPQDARIACFPPVSGG